MEFKDRPWRPASLWRKINRPKQLGQRRYFVSTRVGDKSYHDPGYLCAIMRVILPRINADLMISEEIAVPRPDGGLCWVYNYQAHVPFNFYGPRYLRQVKKQTRKLNKRPIGSSVCQEVGQNGLLTIYRSDLNISYVRHLKLDEKTSHLLRFDISVPEQAAAAIEHYRQLSVSVKEDQQKVIEAAIDRAKTSDNKRIARLFADPEVGEKISQAEDFAAALDQGQFDQAQEIIIAHQEGRQIAAERSREQHSQMMSARAQETIRSLRAGGEATSEQKD